MLYRVFGNLTCAKCQNKWWVRDSQIEAESAKAAQERFKNKYCLCPECLQLAVKAAVTFDSRIYVESMPPL